MASQVRRETKTTEIPGGTSTVRTTTYESSTSSRLDADGPSHYQAKMTPRSLVIQRTSYGGPGTQHGSYSMNSRQNYGNMAAYSPAAGAFANISAIGVDNVKTSRVKEKKDMQDLNERFASYIERVRFLEAQNRKLADELDKLKSKWGKETTAIKAMYQAELDEARKLLDDAEKEKARLQIRVSSMEVEIEEHRLLVDEAKQRIEDQREKIASQNEQISNYEGEINLLRRRVEQMDQDHVRDKATILKLQDSLNRARVDLDNETLAHIDAENRRQTLEEEIEFLKQVHDQEMKELAALAYRDTTNENREFWKNELSSAIREIQVTYDDKLDGMRGELESFYNMKVQEFRTGAAKGNMETTHLKEEVKRMRGLNTDLRSKLADLEARNAGLERDMANMRIEYEEKIRTLEEENLDLKDSLCKKVSELEAILKELQDLMDTKLGLELEITAYRKLLEGEENKVGLKQVVDSWVSSGHVQSTEDSNLKVSQVVKGEMSAKTTYQRSAKGPVSISECSADGKHITVENTGRRDENVGRWKISRNIDGKEKDGFTFPHGFSLRPGGKAKIYAKGQRPASAPATDLESSDESWGIGANIHTKLVNEREEDRATHVQKTIYTS